MDGNASGAFILIGDGYVQSMMTFVFFIVGSLPVNGRFPTARWRRPCPPDIARCAYAHSTRFGIPL
jgi:hypothetical protein